MMAEWFVKNKDAIYGPFTVKKMVGLARIGKIKPHHYVGKGRNGPWKKASKVKGLFSDETSHSREVTSAPKQTRLSHKEPPLAPSAVETSSSIEDPGVTPPPVVPQVADGRVAFQTATPTAVQVNVEQSRTSHSLGISSLVLGVVSLFTCWIPVVSIPLSGLGALLGVIGVILAVTRKGSGVGFSIAGTAINCMVLLIGVMFISTVAAMFKAADSAFDATPTPRQAQRPSTASERTDELPLASTHDTPTSDQSPEWATAGETLELDGAQLRITSVEVGSVQLRQEIGDRPGTSEDVLLVVWIEVSNKSERKKIDYSGWMSDFASLLDLDADLEDDAGNRYAKVRFSAGLKVRDAETNTSIYPNKTIKDAIVFERPIEDVEYLRLTLSGKAVDSDGEFRFEIPGSMIQHR